MGDQPTLLKEAGGRITHRFHARDVNLVVTGAAGFTVHLDGEPPGDDHGVDVDESGDGTLSEPRMYQLVRQRSIRPRTFEIAFDGPGVRAYVFTFG